MTIESEYCVLVILHARRPYNTNPPEILSIFLLKRNNSGVYVYVFVGWRHSIEATFLFFRTCVHICVGNPESEYCVLIFVMLCMVCVDKKSLKRLKIESAHIRDQCNVAFRAWRAWHAGEGCNYDNQVQIFGISMHVTCVCVMVCGDVLVLVLDSRHKYGQFGVWIMVL